MGAITVLPQQVVNKIAAGEVIERPASVVKELVENAIDARASFIRVEAEDGGKKLIRVTDDGAGMSRDDLALAFSSHATSKLHTADDLFSVTTMGFRGEALSSIGAVSHARIVSRPRGSVEGGEVEINGGHLEAPRAKGTAEGTTIEVGDLFFNVPARRKFLRTAATEFAHITEQITRMALARPGIAFKLMHNGRETLNVHATEDRRRRLSELYGRELAEAMLEIDSGAGPVRVTGFAAPPLHCRANGKMQLTFVNSRHVRDRRLSHAIASAYEGLLVRGRYPVIFLFLDVDPNLVDVNVHPTKIEVRFQQGQIVYKTVLNAVREALERADLTPTFQTSARAAEGPVRPALDIQQGRLPGPTASRPGRTPFDRPTVAPQTPPTPAAEASERTERNCHQFRNAYVVEERSDSLAIIDQHALHERIIFDEIRGRIRGARLESQRMLIPAVIEFGKGEKEQLLAEKDNLERLGVELAEFGADAVAVNAVPALLGNCDPEELLREFLAELNEVPEDTPVDARLLALAKRVACKAAIKAGDRLTESEMQSLLERAEATGAGDTCPHGRPVCIVVPYADLERQFKRQ
jgi:DNA mismatch repair protein MutL